MAETLVELVARIKADSTELEKGLKDAEKQTGAPSKNMAGSLKKVGLTMAASGAAITAALGLMGKAAIDEDINIKRLANTINNSGTAYDKVKVSLEKVIAVTQRKTGVADNEQRDILNRLILVTKDYDKALGLLPTALDLAAAGSMDATQAATYLGKAYLELEEGADEVSVRFGQASIKFKSMEDIQNRVAGSAENLANPLNILNNSIEDVSETIGANLIPLIKEATDKISDIAVKIQEWATANPKLAQTLTLLTLGTGGILSLTGGIVLLIPQLVKMGKTFSSLAVSVGVAKGAVWGFYSTLLLIPAVVAAVIIGLDYLDSKFDLPSVKGGNKTLDEQIIGYAKLGDSLEATAARAQGYGESRIILNEREIESLRKLGYEIELIGVVAEKVQIQQEQASSDVKAAIQKLRDSYGDLGKAIQSKADMARSASDQAKRALDSELDKARESYNEQMGFLSSLYSEKIRLLNASANAEIQKIQDQIDGIDKQTDTEARALQDQQDIERKAELIDALNKAKNGEEYKKAKKELEEFLADVERRRLLQSREDEKDKLRESIENIRNHTQNQIDALNEELKAQQQNELDKLTATENRIKETKVLLDEALEKEIARLAIELKDKEDVEIAKLGITKNRLAEEEQANRDSYARQLADAQNYINSLNSIFGGVSSGGGGTSGSAGGGGTPVIPPSGGTPSAPSVPGGYNPDFGMRLPPSELVKTPISLSLNDSSGVVSVQFNQPVFFDREDTMNRFVDKISKSLDRNYRLSGRL